MRRGTLAAGRYSIPLVRSRVCIVGSGAAGLGAAVHLRHLGVRDLLVVTERLGGGTSANAGSDKQTYCRVNPAAEGGDGVYAMAGELFSGGAMHGDIALVEAALSERGFYRLLALGVDFPHDRYGVYPGYRTDHDSRGRGTSAGPTTSIAMFGRLLEEARRLGVPIVDDVAIVRIITEDARGHKRVTGMLGVDRTRVRRDRAGGLLAISADYVVLAVGGPGGLYRDSVYPPDQVGGLGAPLVAGAAVYNLTESQFGIASTAVRWNLSGSYQQVLPRYVSTDPTGRDEQEFLADGFPDPGRLFTAQFLKGYQWPFDVRGVSDFGSSLIDLQVYDEAVRKGRHVFLDFSANPSHSGERFSVGRAPRPVRDYLTASHATAETPVDRLRQLNGPAYDFFRARGIDLSRTRLPAAVCHQHVNGGLAGSIWWETTIRNLFAVGECNGSHGIYRPGGAALNAGQVGSLRAAQMIAHRIATGGRAAGVRPGHLSAEAERLIDSLIKRPRNGRRIDPPEERAVIGRRMSEAMGIVRSVRGVSAALEENRGMLAAHRSAAPADRECLPDFLKNEDLLITERAFLASAKLLLEALAGPRGSFLVGTPDDIAALVRVGKGGRPTVLAPDESLNDLIVECVLDDNLEASTRFVPVRPVPGPSASFERVWAAYRAGDVYADTHEQGGTP